MNSSVGAFSAALKKSIRLRSRGPYLRSRRSEYCARISAERRSQPATMSPLPATATPLLRPRSRSCWLIPRQSGASDGVLMLKSLRSWPLAGTLPLCRKMFYTATQSAIEKRNDRRAQVASDQGLVRATACAIIDKLNKSEITPLDLLDVLERRIADVDGQVNALPTLCFDRARSHAKELMKKPVGERGLLAGMPLPIKDLTNVEGVRTTQGSPIYKDNIPARSDILVEHLEHNGGVIYAKSNTPEFGAGANTFNEVFGATRNPWDVSRSAAGSSGGAAVALATGMAWLAHGSDMGGSLRNPASFCGIVGMRPSIGRVAHTPIAAIDRNLGVQGPMARNVEDLALLLDAMSGEHPADPLSLPALPASFLSATRSGKGPKRIAYSPDLGITPVDPDVAAITRKAAARFAEAGAIVEEAHPDLREAHECFYVLRVRFCPQQGGAAAQQARSAQ